MAQTGTIDIGISVAERDKRIARLRRLATLMDASIRLPGGYQVGVDAVIGLLPIAGDVAGMAVSTWIVLEAHALGLPWRKLAIMAANVAIDTGIGIIPFAGDLFDAAFKANLRNVEIIEQYFAEEFGYETAKDVTPGRH
jgi:hypothetical protein